MATLAAHDPGHGAYPWSWIKTSPFGAASAVSQLLVKSLYHPPVRNKELRLSLLLAHSFANGEKRLLVACASCLSYSAAGWLVPYSNHRIAGSVRPEQLTSL